MHINHMWKVLLRAARDNYGSAVRPTATENNHSLCAVFRVCNLPLLRLQHAHTLHNIIAIALIVQVAHICSYIGHICCTYVAQSVFVMPKRTLKRCSHTRVLVEWSKRCKMHFEQTLNTQHNTRVLVRLGPDIKSASYLRARAYVLCENHLPSFTLRTNYDEEVFFQLWCSSVSSLKMHALYVIKTDQLLQQHQLIAMPCWGLGAKCHL